MKSILLKVFLLGSMILFQSLQCPPQKNDTIYVLLNKNSPNIEYFEQHKLFEGREGFQRNYHLKTGINDFPLNISFVSFGMLIPDMFQHEEFRKPVTFLDSITYYDEKYIMETKKIDENLFHWQKLKDTRIFVIDMGTLENDSVMMYEVTVGFDGYEK